MIFVKTFLLSYQSFTTPDKLLHKLIERYNVVRAEGMDLQQFDANRTTIQVSTATLVVSLSKKPHPRAEQYFSNQLSTTITVAF